MEEKRCSKCGTTKPIDEFHKDHRSTDGVVSSCKPCVKIKRRRCYLNNRDVELRRAKDHRAARNADSRREYMRTWRKNHPLNQSERARKIVKDAVRRGSWSETGSIAEMVGCDFVTLRRHLIQTALKNYGAYWFDEDYHMDHVIPLSAATTYTWASRLCHYSNLQLLTREDNLKKAGRFDWGDVASWLYSQRIRGIW